MNRVERLAVHLDGDLIALLEDRGMGFVALRFTEAAFDRYGEGARMLSLALPVAREVPVERATQFLRGLLPEGRTLELVAQRLRLSTNDTFALLRELGRDCAGALVIVPDGTTVSRVDEVDWLNDADLADWIRTLPEHPLGIDLGGEVRLSLAGVQDKLVVCVDPETGSIGRPLRGTPSTHILKPRSLAQGRDGRLRTPEIVENEAFCMHLAAAAGLPAAATTVRSVHAERTLLVERYDRRRQEDRVIRVHQEDSCQALAIDPLHKYQSAGGPSLGSIARLIREFAAEPLRDLYRLLDAAVFNYAVGNLDAHGKNVSFLHHDDGRVSLAPAYDLVSVAAYPVFAGATLAMSLGDAERLDAASVESVVQAYSECGLSERTARRRLADAVEAIDGAIPRSLERSQAEGWHVPLLDSISADTRTRIHRLQPA